jgi:glucokinase
MGRTLPRGRGTTYDARVNRSSPVLVADVGGTNTRLAVAQGQRLQASSVRTTSGADFMRAVLDLVADRAEKGLEPIAAGCVAVAGPVEASVGGGRAMLTNTPWSLDAADLPFPARMINDLHAACRGVEALLGADGRVAGAEQLGGAAPVPGAPLVVLGLGTGLGQAVLAGGQVLAGEGGHADLAATDARGDALLRFLRDRLREREGGDLLTSVEAPHVSIERLVSGTAMADVLDFAAMRAPLGANAARRLESEPAAAVVVGCAADDPACALAMELLIQGLGAEAGNAALRPFARGGVVIVGGMAARVAPWLRGPDFRQAFEGKGRMSVILKEIPVWLVVDDDIGLQGAAVEAWRLLD